jgi:hypothetical protein
MRAAALAFAAAILAAPAAFADEAIPTADAGGAAPTSEDPSPLDPPFPAEAPGDILVIGPCGIVRHEGEQADDKAHGSVEVGVGTGGYRHVRAHVCKPIGQNGEVSVDVEHTEWGRRARFASLDAAPLR